ncbi:MAG TPA: M23 family metallopeptidase [Sphingomicrobium sp.]|nr:M23 family metallopeptidase [Sphingomicrobium sp.]
MAQSLAAANAVFCDRDLFFHDGSRLRRIRLSRHFQALLFVVLLTLVGWSAYATARMMAPASASFAELEQATELRARQIEQRQQILAAIIAGEQVDAAVLAASSDLADLPRSLEERFARAELVQAAQAQLAAASVDARYRHAASELKRLGLRPDKFAGVGGPLEGVQGDPTFKQLFTSWKKLDNLQNGAIAVPSDKPVKSAAFTSGYGVRSDPFAGRAAMHAGIDLAGALGTPIHATADGVISEAGWNSGGYGNLVKIDHGRGIETRYGHLSGMLVRPGQRVQRGQLIGRMGSTGRSTGSHLHYEVRIDGRAVNPIPFMKSTDYLLAMQKNANSHAMDAVALGGPAGGAKR